MTDRTDPPNNQPLNDQVSLFEVDLVVSRLAKMRGMSATKALALATLASLTGKPQGETIQPMLAVASDPSLAHWREREMAAWTLGRTTLNSDDRDVAAAALMDVLESAARESPWRRILRLGLRCMTAHFGFIFLVGVFGPFSNMSFWDVMLMGAVLTLPFSVPASLWYDKYLSDHSGIAPA